MNCKIESFGDSRCAYGINLEANNEFEKDILRRFEKGGVKINSVCENSGGVFELGLTFSDNVGKMPVIPVMNPLGGK